MVRDLATDHLHFIETKFALHRLTAGLLAEALRATGTDNVIDRCLGGGVPIPAGAANPLRRSASQYLN